MTTPDLATIVDEQEAEIGRLVAELAVVRRDWQADVGTLTARAQTAEAERARLDKQNWNLCAEINAAEERAQTAEARAARLNTEVGYLLEENEEMGRREMQRAAAARKVAQFARKNMAAMQHVQRAQRERDAARAEAARLRSALITYADAREMVLKAMPASIVNETEELWGVTNTQLVRRALSYLWHCAALRGPAQSEKPAERRQEANDDN